MGYFRYFAKVKKEIVDTVKDMKWEELCKYAQSTNSLEILSLEEEEHIVFENKEFLHKEYIYELGRFSDYANIVKEKGTPLFTDEDVQFYTEYYSPYIVDKSVLYELIMLWHKDVLKSYKKLNLSNISEFILHKLTHWESALSIDVNTQDTIRLTNLWDIESKLFELINIYKQTDWENEVLIFYGW